MRRFLPVFLFLLLPVCLWAGPKDTPAKYKGVEIKHFTGAEGVELTAEFYDFLYADLKAELQKAGLFEQIIGEGEVVEDADAPHSAVLDGSLLEYKKGSIVKEKLIGFGAGRRSLRAHIRLVRYSDKSTLMDKDLTVKTFAQWDNKMLARELAKHIAREFKDGIKDIQPAAEAAK